MLRATIKAGRYKIGDEAEALRRRAHAREHRLQTGEQRKAKEKIKVNKRKTPEDAEEDSVPSGTAS